MRQLMIRPVIEQYNTFDEFIAAYKPGKGDLVLTGKTTFKGLEGKVSDATVLYVNNYGTGEPTDEMVQKIVADMPCGVKRVFGIGGGTVLDVAKILAVYESGTIGDLFDKKVPCRKNRKLYLLPTTCGTGSEVTNLSILAFPSRNTKFGLADDLMFADVAILVPELARGCAWRPFAAAAVDALVHALESMLSPKATPYTRMFSEKAADMLLDGFRYIRANGQEARNDKLNEFLLASNLAGIGFGNAGCGAVHALSYPLGGTYHVPHGESNRAMLMPVFYGYGMEATEELRRYLAARLECTTEEALDKLSELIEALLPAKTMAEYGVKYEELETFSQSVLASQQRLLGNAPVPMTYERIRAIYESAYGKKGE